MKILLWHGYLLGGTGSNVYTRALAREWTRAGHEVTVFSQEPEPELYDLSRDPGESKNVAAQNLEVIEQLTARAYQFDTALQRDRRPMQIVDGPAPPAPQTIRTPETDLAGWQKRHAPLLLDVGRTLVRLFGCGGRRAEARPTGQPRISE